MVRNQKVVEVDEEYNVEIEDIGTEGDGIAKVGDSNFVVIVPDSDIGDKVKIKITKALQTLAFGEVIEEDVYVED